MTRDRLKSANKPTPSCGHPGDFPSQLCVMPWINQHVGTDGKISPCCEYDGSIGALSDTTLDDAWNSQELHEIRRKFATGEEVRACWKCFDREANEGHSLRMEANSKFPHWHEILLHNADLLNAAPKHAIALDLRFSNLCNFKCRSCWHGASSKWFTDGKAIGVTAGEKAEIKSFDSLDEMVSQIGPGMDGLEEIYFAGGEPLLMDEHYALLRLLHDRGQTHIKLSYNTNLSVTGFAGQSIFDLWAKFDKLEITASVDAAGARGAYVRSGFNWDTFVNNIHQLKIRCPHSNLRFGITVSALNILSLTDLCRALENKCDARPCDFQLHSLQEPAHYRTQVLPAKLKHTAGVKMEAYLSEISEVGRDVGDINGFASAARGIIAYMNADDLSDKLPNLQFITSQLDTLRSENMGVVLPELVPAFEKTSWWKKPWVALRKQLR